VFPTLSEVLRDHCNADDIPDWETLREGLPQRDAYDLVYRHGLAVDDGGERLAMGSTTGHLWISEDGGARWSLAGANLPPIACLRFG